jgi:hypothetical protein
MSKPRSEKKPEPAERRVLPMELQVGDRLVDETGEWEVASRACVTTAGKDAHVRVKRVGQRTVTEIRKWRAHERIKREASRLRERSPVRHARYFAV